MLNYLGLEFIGTWQDCFLECLGEDCGKELISILSVFLSYYTLGILILESAKAKRSEAKNVSEQKSVKNFFGGITDFQIFHRSLFYSS